MYWTTAVTKAIQEGTLKDYLEQCNGQIDQIVTLVRGKLPSMARIALGALIVIDVHGKGWQGLAPPAGRDTCTHVVYMCALMQHPPINHSPPSPPPPKHAHLTAHLTAIIVQFLPCYACHPPTIASPLLSARDVVSQLHKDQVQTPDDFNWISQLRYYMEDGRVVVRMITTDVPYGYEYLGNSGRLVITPLTDRCYR